jgi:hypothetical protein
MNSHSQNRPDDAPKASAQARDVAEKNQELSPSQMRLVMQAYNQTLFLEAALELGYFQSDLLSVPSFDEKKIPELQKLLPDSHFAYVLSGDKLYCVDLLNGGSTLMPDANIARQLVSERGLPSKDKTDVFIRKLSLQQMLMMMNGPHSYLPAVIGLCNGIAYMGALAYLAKDIDHFNRRYRLLYLMPRPGISERLEQAKRNVIEKQKTNKKEDSKKMQMERDTFARKMYEARTLNDLEKNLSLEERAILDQEILELRNFFDGVMLFQTKGQNWNQYDCLFESKTKDSSHGGTMVIPISAPVTFDTQNPVVLLDNEEFDGLYHANDMFVYLESFKRTCERFPMVDCSLVLDGIQKREGHVISVSYNAQSQEWVFIDIHQMPAKKINDIHFLSRMIIAEGFFDVEQQHNTFIKTHIMARGSPHDLQNFMGSWKSDPQWQQIHRLDAKKAEQIDRYSRTLLHLKAGDIKAVTELLQHGADSSKREDDGTTPIQMADANTFPLMWEQLHKNVIEMKDSVYTGRGFLIEQLHVKFACCKAAPGVIDYKALANEVAVFKEMDSICHYLLLAAKESKAEKKVCDALKKDIEGILYKADLHEEKEISENIAELLVRAPPDSPFFFNKRLRREAEAKLTENCLGLKILAAIDNHPKQKKLKELEVSCNALRDALLNVAKESKIEAKTYDAFKTDIDNVFKAFPNKAKIRKQMATLFVHASPLFVEQPLRREIEAKLQESDLGRKVLGTIVRVETDLLVENYQHFKSFTKDFMDHLDKLPKSRHAVSIFPAAHSKLSEKCKKDMGIILTALAEGFDNKHAAQHATKECFKILCDYKASLVKAGSKRYLQQLNQFLEKYALKIPEKGGEKEEQPSAYAQSLSDFHKRIIESKKDEPSEKKSNSRTSNFRLE